MAFHMSILFPSTHLNLPNHSQPPPRMTGLAGSHGPTTTFLYRCKPMSHQLQPPMPKAAPTDQKSMPKIIACQPPFFDSVIPETPPAPRTRKRVRTRCPRQETWRRCLRKTGKRPKTSMLKRVKLKTCVVLGRREARTVEDIRAALVDSEAGNLPVGLAPTVVKDMRTEITHLTPTPPP